MRDALHDQDPCVKKMGTSPIPETSGTNPEETGDVQHPIFEENIATPDHMGSKEELDMFITPLRESTTPSCSSTNMPRRTGSCSRIN